MTSAPSSTYRLQISRDFTLADATALLDYLADLGTGAVYLSPLLRSTTGSAHGYDTVDVTRIDPDRGGEEGLEAVFAAAEANGLGVVIDIVPNHLGIEVPAENPPWWDVLQNGYWHARSLEFIGSGRMKMFEWLRMPGDVVFIVFGAVPLLIAALKAYFAMRGLPAVLPPLRAEPAIVVPVPAGQ